MKLFYCTTLLLSILLVGVAEAKDVVIKYDDFLKILATTEHKTKLLSQCKAENGILLKLNDEHGTMKRLSAEQLQALMEENETRKKLGETQEQINQALQAQLLSKAKELDGEKRLSRYKSEAFLLGVVGAVLWVMN